MCKVVVFDSGFGGDILAERLSREMPVVEVIKVIDWRRAPYCEKGEREVRKMTEEALKPYIGRVDAIVLASYVATVAALRYLRMKYPEQKFIGMAWPRIRGDREEPVLVITTDMVRRSRNFRRTRERVTSEVSVQVWDKWMTAVEDGEMSEQKIKLALSRMRQVRPKIVVLGSTNLIDIREKIERVCYGAVIKDGQADTIRRLGRAIGVRGDPK